MLHTTGFKKEYIVLNFAYGTGPYLRTTDLALAFNKELEQRKLPRMGIIVPWLYGEKQRRIMLEEFAEEICRNPGEILLDPQLGRLYAKVFYGGRTYREALSRWVDQALPVSAEAHHYLKGELAVETLEGVERRVEGSRIRLELNRSPRLRYDVSPAYFTSFASLAEILERAQKEKSVEQPRRLLSRSTAIACAVEEGQQMYCIAYPATFAHLSDRKPYWGEEKLVPPIAPLPSPHRGRLDKGIFVTVTGIPGLARLYKEARALGLKIYSNDTEAVEGSEFHSPHVIPNKSIMFQFARAGWSSVWLSMNSGTPLVVPAFDPGDDPEIHFNNESVRALGLGLVYEGQSLQELLQKRDAVSRKAARVKKEVQKRFGTVDGISYCATLFVEDFLKG